MAHYATTAIECTENEEETLNDEKQRLVTNDNERQGKTKLTPVDLCVSKSQIIR
jgi:hypothetical protein